MHEANKQTEGRPEERGRVSWRLNAGAPGPQVAEWAGHSVEVLYRIYAHCIDGDDRRWHKRMEDLPGQPGVLAVRRTLVISRSELAGCGDSHSAYIPGLVTSGGLSRHTAAQPFSLAQIIFAGQDRFGLVRLGASSGAPRKPSPARTAASRAGRLVIGGSFQVGALPNEPT